MRHPALVSRSSFLVPVLPLALLCNPAAGPHESDTAASAPPALLVATENATGRWIVHLAHDAEQHRAELRELAAARRARDRARVDAVVAARERRFEPLRVALGHEIAAAGGTVVGTTWLANTLAFEGGAPNLPARLAARDDVRLVQAETWHRAQLEVATDADHHNSDLVNQWLSPAGQALVGTGVTIALVDSGIDARHVGTNRPHAAFFPNGSPASSTGPGIAGSRLLSATNCSVFSVQSGEDVFGHGTRMASLAAGAQFNALPDVDDAPAPGALLRSYKISDDAFGGLASTFSMENAFEKLLLDLDVTVANMSYDGSPGSLASPNTAIEAATLADVFVTLSAGNFGADLGGAHGCFNPLVVGASWVDTREPLDFPGFVTSAIGPLPGGRRYPQLLATGEALTCAKMDAELQSIESWGCSGASALTSGSAALVRQAAPDISALATKALVLAGSEPVVLGPLGARGFGYLRTDRAVDLALDGLVVEETVTTGILKRHKRFLCAGDSATFALVWNRETPTDLAIDDLDLRVRDPQGQLVAWSASAVDNIELIRFTATVDGVHEIQVLPVQFDGDGTATYALAGVDTHSIDPGACTSGAPSILDQSPAAIPALVQGFDQAIAPGANKVLLTGCNFAGVTSVQVQGQPVVFQVVDANTLAFDMPLAQALGDVPIRIVAPTGTLDSTIVVAAADDVLAASANIVNGHMGLWLGGRPGDVFALGYSPSLLPSVLPGVIAADIGNAFSQFVLLGSGVLPLSNGIAIFGFQNVPGTVGQYFHFQAITIDPLTFALPFATSNVATSIWTH
jgi:hypothetical protein